MTVLDRFAEKLAALREWFVENDPPSYGNAHGFALAEPMNEGDIRRIEQDAGVALPLEYRSFLLRFGDGEVGPGWYSRLQKGLSAASKQQFPLSKPLLGTCSPSHQRLSRAEQQDELLRLLPGWEAIPKQDGVLAICDYGCSMYGRLILNGPFCGRVWMLAGDAAYYGPFGGSEALHDEYADAGDWEATETPRDYSFFEWYETWLDGRLKVADLADRY